MHRKSYNEITMNTAAAEVTPITKPARKRKSSTPNADGIAALHDALEQPVRYTGGAKPATVKAHAKSATVKAHAKSAAPAKISRRPGIIEQIRIACSREHRLATMIGALLGAIVPFVTFVLAHFEVAILDVSPDVRKLVVLGGLVFSMSTVIAWGRLALGSTSKAIAFALLVEGTMVLSSHLWLAVIMLIYLAGINAIATGVTLARGAEQLAKRATDGEVVS